MPQSKNLSPTTNREEIKLQIVIKEILTMMGHKTQLHLTQISPRTWTAVGEGDNVYILQLARSSLRCSCTLGKQGKTCLHMDRLADYFKTAINDVIAPSQVSLHS